MGGTGCELYLHVFVLLHKMRRKTVDEKFQKEGPNEGDGNVKIESSTDDGWRRRAHGFVGIFYGDNFVNFGDIILLVTTACK